MVAIGKGMTAQQIAHAAPRPSRAEAPRRGSSHARGRQEWRPVDDRGGKLHLYGWILSAQFTELGKALSKQGNQSFPRLGKQRKIEDPKRRLITRASLKQAQHILQSTSSKKCPQGFLR